MAIPLESPKISLPMLTTTRLQENPTNLLESLRVIKEKLNAITRDLMAIDAEMDAILTQLIDHESRITTLEP